MPKFQPSHKPGDTAEQCHHPDIPEREGPRHDLSREVGALACGPACPHYRGELDSQDTNMAPTQIESNSMSGTTEKETTEKDTDRGSLRIIVRTKQSDVLEIVHIDPLQKDKVHLRHMIRKGMVPSAAVSGPVIIVPAERTTSYVTRRRAKV